MSSSTPSTSSATSTVLASVSLITVRPRLGSPLVREIPDRPEPTSRTSATSPSKIGSPPQREIPSYPPRYLREERKYGRKRRSERHPAERQHWVRQRPEHLRPRRNGPRRYRRRPPRREGLQGLLSLRARWWCLLGSRVRLRRRCPRAHPPSPRLARRPRRRSRDPSPSLCRD